MRINKSSINFLVLIASCFFALIFIKGLDFIAGTIINSPSSNYEYQRFVNLREHNPDSNIYFLQSTCKHLNNSFVPNIETNEDGFIEQKIRKNQDSGFLKIIFYGGSTTENLCVRNNQRFPSLVGSSISQILDLNVHILNSGVSGNTSMHSLLSFYGKGINQKPDIIFFMHAVNDLSILLKSNSYWSQPGTREIIIEDSTYRNIIMLSRELINFFAPNIRQLLIEIRSKNTSTKDEFLEFRNSQIVSNKNIDEIISNYKSSIMSFINSARAWNIKAVLMTQPNMFLLNDDQQRNLYNAKPQPIDYESFIELYSIFNEIIREVASENNIFLIDLEKELPKGSSFFYDSIHLNDSGNFIAADIISNKIIENWDLFQP